MEINGHKFLGTAELIGVGAKLKWLTQFATKANKLSRECITDYLKGENIDLINCDVCNNPHVRKQYFMLVSTIDPTDILLIGRSCLGPFSEHQTSVQLAKKLEAHLAENDIDKLGRIDLQIYLSWVASYVERHGWVSKKTRRSADNDVTANAVWKLLVPEPPIYQLRYAELSHMNDLKRKELLPREWHNDDALFAIQDVLDYPEELMNSSSYHANLNAVARAGYVDEQTCGLAANILREYQNKQMKVT